MATAKPTKKCVNLELKRKIELIERVENRKKQKEVAFEFGVSANTVSTIMKHKEKYREDFFCHKVTSKQRNRQAKYEDVETQLLEWFTSMRANNMPLSGPILKEKARTISTDLGKPD